MNKELNIKFKAFQKRIQSTSIKVIMHKIETGTDTICISWEAVHEPDRYFESNGAISLSEAYFIDVRKAIKDIFGEEARFNNTGRIGWIFISIKENGGR